MTGKVVSVAMIGDGISGGPALAWRMLASPCARRLQMPRLPLRTFCCFKLVKDNFKAKTQRVMVEADLRL